MVLCDWDYKPGSEKFQPSVDASEVIAGSGEEYIDSVPGGMFKEVAPHPVIYLRSQLKP